MSFIANLFSRNKVAVKKSSSKPKELDSLPTGRSSVPEGSNTIKGMANLYDFVNPDFDFESIPLIRKLIRVNPDFGQALWDMIFLGNTGHKLRFDSDINPLEIDKMRDHIDRVCMTWTEGCAGKDGLANRMFSQVIIAGAIANEWVPNRDLNGIDKVAFIKPETIRYQLNNRGRYDAFQKASQMNATGELGFVKLNPNTFKYWALYTDSEVPYGLPPFIAALEPLVTQGILNDNIKKVSRQVSLMGFLKILLMKPRQRDGQSKTSYRTELNNNLDQTKERVKNGLNDGIVVGYDEDVSDMDFQSTTKGDSAVTEIYNLNEQQIFSGLKSDGSLFGRDYGTSETQITIVLTKLISELYNIQNLVKSNLEFGYAMELWLAGFNPKGLKVEFNKSTLLDELKMQQGKEIKITNLHKLYYDGIINLDQYADELGYEKADQKEPRELWEVTAPKQDVNKPKDATRKKGDRQKSKTQEKKQ